MALTQTTFVGKPSYDIASPGAGTLYCSTRHPGSLGNTSLECGPAPCMCGKDRMQQFRSSFSCYKGVWWNNSSSLSSTALQVAILRRWALQVGLPLSQARHLSKELLFIHRNYQIWKVSQDGNYSSFFLVSRRRSKTLLFLL